MSYIQPHDSGRKVTGMVFVLVLHALLVYYLGVLTGRLPPPPGIYDPLETKIIEELKPPPDKPPPPPPPKFAPLPPPYIPPPEVQVQLPASVSQYAITAVTSTKPVHAPVVVAPKPVTRSAAIASAKDCEKPEYPISARRAHEEGEVHLAFLIDVDGKILDSKVEKSTASRQLNEAARKALELCKFHPALVDGRPEKSWAKIIYEWKLE